MTMEIAALERAIGPVMKGAYLFCGPEDYLKEHYRARIRKALLPDETLAAFNHARLAGTDGLAALGGEAATLPMMADRRLIEIEDVVFSPFKKEALEALAALAEKVKTDGDCVLLFYTREGEFSLGTTKKPTEAAKILGKTIAIVNFERQSQARLAGWLGRHFTAEGVFAPPEVCMALVKRAGRDMNALSGEVGKLSAYALSHGEKTVNEAMIALLVRPTVESGEFDFVNAIMARDLDRAFALFSEKKARREAPVAIAASIARVVSELAAIQTFAQGGMDAAAIAKELKMSEYPVKLRLNALKSFPRGAIEEAVRLCYRTDLKLKSRCADKYFLIERLIFALAGQITEEEKRTAGEKKAAID